MRLETARKKCQRHITEGVAAEVIAWTAVALGVIVLLKHDMPVLLNWLSH